MTPTAADGRRALPPLCAAGFLTAFGSHGVAANLGVGEEDLGQRLLVLGVMLALYDGAEVVLKPLFGMLADRVGLRPVLLGGLAGFAAASAAFALASGPLALGAARFAQGAAASAFSPAAGALVARLVAPGRRGRAFGGYGAWKSLGYTAGPLLGGVLVVLGGLPWVFAAMALAALVVLGWAALAVPGPAPLPRRRQGLTDLTARVTDPGFLAPAVALAVTAAALSCAVGFLPLVGAGAGLGPVATGAAVSALAVAAAAGQPVVGRLRDRGRLAARPALVAGTLVTAGGLAVPALAPGLGGLVVGAVAIGVGTALLTPVAFALLAASGPPERLGQTMGTAEVGREVGEAGGPLFAGAVAAFAGLGAGFVAIAAVVALATLAVAAVRRREVPGG